MKTPDLSRLDSSRTVFIYIGIGFPGTAGETQGLPGSVSRKAAADVGNLRREFGDNVLVFLKSDSPMVGKLWYRRDTFEFAGATAVGVPHLMPSVSYFGSFWTTLAYALCFLPNLWLSTRTVTRCVRRITKAGIAAEDIVIVSYSPTLGFTYPAYRAKKKYGCRFVEILDCGPVFKDRGLQRRLILEIFRSHDGVITYVAGSARDFAPEKPYVEVFFPVADDLLELFRAAVRDEGPTGVDDRTPVIAYTGHLSDVYQISQVIRLIRKTGRRYRWRFAGYGPLAQELEALAQNPDFDVDFLGLVDITEAARVMTEADLLLCQKGGSVTEFDRYKARYAASGKLTEYLASGTPVLASDIPAFSDQIKPFVHLVSPHAGDDEVIDAISVIFANYEHARVRARQGQEFAFANFSSEVQRRRSLDFIERIAAREDAR